MNWNDNVQFPKRVKPLPSGYRIVQLDSGHFLWVRDCGNGDHDKEGLISVDKWWVRRCAFMHAAGELEAE